MKLKMASGDSDHIEVMEVVKKGDGTGQSGSEDDGNYQLYKPAP